MELTWDNLRDMFELASKTDDIHAPYVDASDVGMTIDGDITREFVDRFIAQQVHTRES
jgi:hypothetical protein